MKKIISLRISLIVALILLIASPLSYSNALRSKVSSLISPTWNFLWTIRTSFNFFNPHFYWKALASQTVENQLLLEIHLLKNELSNLHTLLNHYEAKEREFQKILGLQENPTRNQEELALSAYKIRATPARVLFRPLDLWNHALWINLGEFDNEKNPENPIIAKNSPVLGEKGVIGIVEQVGYRQSRVCLITDPALNLSVRALRGKDQHNLIKEQLESLIPFLEGDACLSLSFKKELLLLLKQTLKNFSVSSKNIFLAKGELQGLSESRKSSSLLLKGTGFNYDFSDSLGESRGINESKLYGKEHSLIEIGDLLVTTGMDGIFPAGFNVAIVSKVAPFSEGDYFYEVEAKPIEPNLQELSSVFILPPLFSPSLDLSF